MSITLLAAPSYYTSDDLGYRYGAGYLCCKKLNRALYL